MTAIYSNFQSSTTTTAPLLIAGTSLDSSGFANLPTIAAPDYMWCVLDPTGVAGLPEIVQITAHTAASTNVTIVRAQQATVARQHLAGTIWRHSSTKADFDAIPFLAPAGTIRQTVNPSADAGWLLFNQTATGAQTSYPALWAVAPAAWKSGADLVLPNLANTLLGGAGTIVLGASGGANTKTISANNLPVHTHPIFDPAHSHTYPYAVAGSVGSASVQMSGTATTGSGSTSYASTGITGTGNNTTTATALDVTPAQLAIVYQIKAH